LDLGGRKPQAEEYIMFSLFKRRTFKDTATELAGVYKDSLAKGFTPKRALEEAVGTGMKRHPDLSNISAGAYNSIAENYLFSIHKDKFRNIGSDPMTAAPVVRRALAVLIGGYLHKECNPGRYLLEIEGCDDPNRPDNALERLLESLI
jgi:hypothetical protein